MTGPEHDRLYELEAANAPMSEHAKSSSLEYFAEFFAYWCSGNARMLALLKELTPETIPDVKTGDAFASDIYEFYRAGILTGSDAKGTFHPASSIKRSEVSAILVRMFDTASRQSITLQ